MANKCFICGVSTFKILFMLECYNSQASWYNGKLNELSNQKTSELLDEIHIV